MPPLHRMPVFYAFALLTAGGYAIGTWLASDRATQRSTAPHALEASKKKAELPPRTRNVASPLAVPTDGILRTSEGLRRKVLIKDLDLVCQSEPEGGKLAKSPLDYFAIRYVYGESSKERPTAFQLGSNGQAEPCWVPAASVLEWDTRLMARPTSRQGRAALVIYRDESCLLDVLAHRPCPRHAGHCPTEGEERTDDSRIPALGMPILGSRAIPEPDGSTRTIFQVASLVRDQAPPPPPPATPPKDLLPSLRRVDIAFVIDTTASMQATIVASRTLAQQLVADAADRHRDVTIRLALVDYRDDSPIFGHTARIVTRFTSATNFLAALETLSAARRGDGSIDEAVFDGLAQALPAGADDRSDASHLDWPTGRAGELATKLIVLLGDAPDHAQDLARAQALAKRAKDAGITIATVALDRPGTLSRQELARYRAQWQTLAEGSFLPLEKEKGFTRTVPPLALQSADANQLVAMLQSIIDDRIKHARDLAALAAAEAEGRLVDYVNSQGLTLDQVAPVLVDLHSGEPSGHARPDPRFQGRKAPSVRIGWIAEQRDGQALVSVETLMSRQELGALIDELTQLQLAAQGTARDLAELAEIGTAAAAGEASFLATDRGTQTFADHLRRRQGLPPARPESLLHRTQADLLQADDTSRAALNDRLAATLSELVKRRNSSDWDDPRRTVDGMALVPYALIDF
ncbi:von Willebrand factor type A domain-containing protein [Singulisphaera sp. GP187]|uniref:VWA domain-containing protein n=1 Tax=Singulisphaera sp. GP187 TaxID=1882752 RepID=UPI0009286C73|nr:VWA domain-containing protein [Singulisphaera sp. GP187]SIO64723.1 von Willebrand factor type A domain-containing protein [Singulisphaera sp. GP187]